MEAVLVLKDCEDRGVGVVVVDEEEGGARLGPIAGGGMGRVDVVGGEGELRE